MDGHLLSRILVFAMLIALGLSPASATNIGNIEDVATKSVEFSLPDIDGYDHSLADYRGEWVVVNYWATWCAPCRKEIPDLSQMHDNRSDITVLGLAFEDTDVDVFREFLVEYPASYPILLVDVYDPPADFGAPRALPTTYLIDPAGDWVHTWIGPVTSVMISDWIADEGIGETKEHG